MELEENPIVVKTDKMSWGTNWSPIWPRIMAAEVCSQDNPPTTIPMNIALAPMEQRTERKATINLPPSSPSRGPRGRMVLITP